MGFDTAAIDTAVAQIREQGFVVIPNLLSSDDVAALRDALRPFLRSELLGRNNFEGYATERVYSLVARHRLFADLVEHPAVLGICDAFLEPNYLLTASQAINIHPGETPQPFHTDDAFYKVPRPRQAFSVSTIFAIDDFTRENGATQIIPKSHTWGEPVGARLEEIDFRTQPKEARRPEVGDPLGGALNGRLLDVTMTAGSVIVFLGTLLHRGGANRSDQPRLAISNQYCEPWARQQENYFLSIPRVEARRMSERVQQLLGYSIHPPFMGHANGMHPRRLLQEDG